MLLGSPGLGKSRLIDELGRRLGEQASIVAAQCDAAGGATFAPVAEALRQWLGARAPLSAPSDRSGPSDELRATIEAQLCGTEPDPSAEALAKAERTRIIAGITALLAGAPPSPEETFFVIRRLLTALAQQRPVVLVIDDLQWAEPLLLDLVEHLIQWGGGVPLFVLVGARPELRERRSSLVTPGGLASEVVTLGGPLAFDEHLCLVEVGADGRFVRIVFFDLDDSDAA